MNSAIEEIWRDYPYVTVGEEENVHQAHEHGWKDDAEWILTELLIDKKISKKDFNKYINTIK